MAGARLPASAAALPGCRCCGPTIASWRRWPPPSPSRSPTAFTATAAEGGGYLNPEAAGRYICVPRRRIHELTSAGLLTPDGYDGRTPLYRRQTLDEYVTAAGGEP